jgi:predicted ester cyclase
MSAEENKEKVRRLLEEAYGEGKVEVVDEVLHSDFVCYDPNSESGEIRGAETVKGEIEYFRNAGLTFIVEDQIAEGDKVATRWTATGTHQGEFFDVIPTGKRIEMTGINIDHFDESGKLVEEWPEYDLLGTLRHLGAVPEPGQTTRA